MKNTFALVNKTPPEILSLIPDYWEDDHKDETLIKLTHVCRGWREIFISRPSLWTDLDCTNVDKTRVYIDRSKSSPLQIHLERSYHAEAFLLAVPHIPRLKNLVVSGDPTEILPALVEHFSCPIPLLDRLKISFVRDAPKLPEKLFNGDLSSLRKLTLSGVTTSLPWRGLSNLTTFSLCHAPRNSILLTQLLDFFESALHLRYICIHDSIPNSSDAPVERTVLLPHLEDLHVIAQPAHSILLNHLLIPDGASLRLEFTFSGKEFPIPSYLPESPKALDNLSHITAANFCFGPERRFMQLHGPSGELSVLGNWIQGREPSHTSTARLIQTLDQFDISRIQSLAVTLSSCRPRNPDITKWTFYRTLCRMDDLLTLMLTQCKNLPFIDVLNPNKNPSKTVLCPKLEDITLYINHPDEFHIDELLKMAEGRASRGAKLSTITIVSTDALAPTRKVFLLRKHVDYVEYKFDDELPEWDTVSG